VGRLPRERLDDMRDEAKEEARIPIIRLYDMLVVSIQVVLSDDLVGQLKEDITAAIEKRRAHGLVIDVSGIDIMDSYISRAIRDIGLIARLMGVDAVICGIAPAVAITLVEMDMDLQGVHAELNLESALEWLQRLGSEKEEATSATDAPDGRTTDFEALA
jgi:rsbT antagonist protein RsbS